MAHETGVRVQQFVHNRIYQYSQQKEKARSQHDVRVNPKIQKGAVIIKLKRIEQNFPMDLLTRFMRSSWRIIWSARTVFLINYEF